MSGLSISELTARMAEGEEEAFACFHDRYFDRLYRYLLVVTGGDEQGSLDVLQDTLLRVTRYVRRFQQEDAFWSWLTVLARSAARDRARRHQSYLKMLAGYARGFLGLEKSESPSRDADAELRACVNASLAALDELDRRLIEEKYFGGKSVKDLARDSELTPKAIESRLLRARRMIKEQVMILLDDERAE